MSRREWSCSLTTQWKTSLLAPWRTGRSSDCFIRLGTSAAYSGPAIRQRSQNRVSRRYTKCSLPFGSFRGGSDIFKLDWPQQLLDHRTSTQQWGVRPCSRPSIIQLGTYRCWSLTRPPEALFCLRSYDASFSLVSVTSMYASVPVLQTVSCAIHQWLYWGISGP